MMLLSCYNPGIIEAGCDEAGRGCLAGPVFAAAVVLPENFTSEILNDSKQLSEKQRYNLREIILNEAVAWALGICDQQEIDRINILNASILAMHKALKQLKLKPQHILVDGNRFKPFEQIPHTCFVKGDGRFMSVAAASILAKTFRDDYMQKIHTDFPEYGWDQNKGYPTEYHRNVIARLGITEHHRKTFRLSGTQLTLNL
ncbi:MAG TPA: ribonuclease HII [Prolixibacteraceae bacterium]|nr:ribonuclease HII [Prolixibacteraceae bacterium]